MQTLRKGKAWQFAIGVVALAAGVSTAVFSLAYAVVFRPLPLAEQDRLRVIWKTDPRGAFLFSNSHIPNWATCSEVCRRSNR